MKKDANIRSVCKVTKWNQEFTLTLGELNLALKNPAQFFNESSVILGVIHEVGFLLGVHLHNAVHVILMNHLCSFTSQRDHALKKANKQINGEWSVSNLGERQKSGKKPTRPREARRKFRAFFVALLKLRVLRALRMRVYFSRPFARPRNYRQLAALMRKLLVYLEILTLRR